MPTKSFDSLPLLTHSVVLCRAFLLLLHFNAMTVFRDVRRPCPPPEREARGRDGCGSCLLRQRHCDRRGPGQHHRRPPRSDPLRQLPTASARVLRRNSTRRLTLLAQTFLVKVLTGEPINNRLFCLRCVKATMDWWVKNTCKDSPL